MKKTARSHKDAPLTMRDLLGHLKRIEKEHPDALDSIVLIEIGNEHMTAATMVVLERRTASSGSESQLFTCLRGPDLGVLSS